VRSECEPIDLIVKESHDPQRPGTPGADPSAAEDRQGPRGCGYHTWVPAFWADRGIRPGEAWRLLNEILGRSECAPIVFGSHAPDSGNSARSCAHYGHYPSLRRRYLEPLLDNQIVSCFSHDRAAGRCRPESVHHHRAFQDRRPLGSSTGEKWFSSFASMASFFDRDGRDGSGRFAVPTPFDVSWCRRDAGGFNSATPMSGSVTSRSAGGGREGYVRVRENVRVPADHMLGPRGRRFRGRADSAWAAAASTHAMRTVGPGPSDIRTCSVSVPSPGTPQGEMLERQTHTSRPADGGRLVGWMIEAFPAADLADGVEIDQAHNDYKAVRARDILPAVKAMMQKVLA